MIDGILSCLMEILFAFVLLPIIAILATPIILFGAVFVDRPYVEALKDGYYNVFDFWKNLLAWF